MVNRSPLRPTLYFLAAIAVAGGACKQSPPAGSGAAEQPGGAKAAVEAPAAVTEAAAPAPKEVLLWHAYRDAEREALDKLIAAWNSAHPAIQVKALAVPFDALVDKVQVAVPRGNGPDLVIFAHDKIGTWARDGLIQPLGPFATPERLGRFLPQTVKPLVFERALYGLPLAFKSLVLFYNKKLVPQPPATMAELVAAGKSFTNKDKQTWGLAYDAADLYYHAAFLHAYGGRVIDEEKKSLAIDTPEAVAAAAAVREIVARHGILPTGMSGFVITAMFSDGKVPFVFNGPWFIAEIGQGVEWGVAPLPTADNGQPLKPFLGSEAVLLSKETRVREEALQVMDFLTSDEAALTRVKAGRQMVANAAVYANPSVAADPVVKVFRAQADNAVPMSNLAEAGVAWQPYSNALRKVVFGGENPAVALKEAAAKATAAMEKLRK